MNCLFRTSFLLVFLLAFGGQDAVARYYGGGPHLTGEIEWGYAHYDESRDGVEKQTAEHFTQRYSFLYSMQGLLANGQAGYYDLGVGAEWAAFDADHYGDSVSKDAFKLLYEGRVQIAPGGLPFRLTAYSYDLNKITFSDSLPAYAGGARVRGRLLHPSIVGDLYNGQTIVSGVQFMAGIRNGSYLGRYRELLSQWPRLLIDYRDVYRRDMKSENPQHYRDRNLAFVSLNKKDNWFHYRLYQHDDYEHPENDSDETVIMLGTIDHTLKRQWINMTNWIRISIDGSYTVDESRWDSRKTERYDLNLLTSMSRRNFQANSLLNMQRIRRGDSVESILDMPAYAFQRIDPNTSVRSSLNIWRKKKDSIASVFDAKEESYHATVLLATGQRERVRIDPSLEAEVYTSDRADGQAVRGRIEAYGNDLRRKGLSWHGMSSMALFTGTSDDDDTNLWESELQGSVDYRLRNNLTLGGSQYLLFGTGDYSSRSTRYLRSASAGAFLSDGASDSQIVDGTMYRSRTALFAEHTTRKRIRNRFNLLYSFQDSDGVQLGLLELSHRLDYQTRFWRLSLENYYATGDETPFTQQGSGALGQDFFQGTAKDQFRHRAIAEYRPNSYWNNRLEVNYTWSQQDAGGESSHFLQVVQEAERVFYVPGGMRRKYGVITQSLSYDQAKDGDNLRAIVFTLGGDYYPTTYWRVGAWMSYYDLSYESDRFYYSLSTGLDFPLFDVDFNYMYGSRKDDHAVAHRYELNVRKTF